MKRSTTSSTLVTTNAAKTLRIQDKYGIEEGKAADFLVLDAPSAFEALRLVPARLHVFKNGREIAYTIPTEKYAQEKYRSRSYRSHLSTVINLGDGSSVLLPVNIYRAGRQKHDNNHREHCFNHHQCLCWPCQRKSICRAEGCGVGEGQEEIINEMRRPFCRIAIHLLRKHKISSLMATI